MANIIRIQDKNGNIKEIEIDKARYEISINPGDIISIEGLLSDTELSIDDSGEFQVVFQDGNSAILKGFAVLLEENANEGAEITALQILDGSGELLSIDTYAEFLGAMQASAAGGERLQETIANLNDEDEQALERDPFIANQRTRSVLPEDDDGTSLNTNRQDTPADAPAPGGDFFDTEALAPTFINFDGDTNNDGIFNKDELGPDGTITARIGLPSDVTPGDTITINGIALTITAADIAEGSVPFEVEPNTTVIATITDQNDNTSTDIQNISPSIDISVEAPTGITFLGDTNADNVFNNEEVGNDNTITAQIGLPSDTQAGDTLTINGQNIILTNSDISNGYYNFELPLDEDISVTITDQAGNTSDPVNANAPIYDLEAQAQNDTTTTNENESVTIDALANDEAGSTITGVEVPTNSQGEPLGTVEIVMVDGKQQIQFTPNDTFNELTDGETQNVEITYSIEDSAGNENSATINVNVEGQNDALELSVTVETAEFREDLTNAGDAVGQASATDEDGGDIKYAIENDANGFYAIDEDTGAITLTQAGADHVNAGNDLPDFSVKAESTSGNTSEASANVNPADTDVNEALTLSVTAVTEIVEDSVDTDTVIATSDANDPDGGDITYSLSSNPNGYYAIDADTGSVTLTQAGVDHVNGGNDLPSFEVTANSTSGQTSSDSAEVSPVSTTDVNDAVELTVTQTLDIIIEGDAAENMVIATTSTYDEDGDVVTITVSDTVNYKVDENGQILLTQAGADLVNSGADLPDYQVFATDGIQDTPTAVNVNPVDTTDKPDVPEISNITDTNGDMTEILVHGTGEAGNTVTLYDRDNNIIGTTTVESDGSWSIDIAGLSNDVDHFIKATQTNASNIESDATQEVHTVQSDTHIVTDSSDDYIFTGEGNDFVQYNGDDNNDNLVIDGGDGSDTVTFTNETDDLTINLNDDQNETIGDDSVELRNIENVYGGQGDDTITGDDQNNILYGDGGNDTIQGGKGDDGVYGGDGDDTLYGGQGNDVLGGGKGNDTLIGGEGDDRLHGQGGDDIVIGGAGNDTIRTDGGTDTVVFSGNLADYTFNHNSSNSHIIAIDNRPDSPDGTDDVYGAEFFQFADITVSTAIVHSPSIDVISSSDTGDSNTDNITNDSTPTVQIPLAAGVTAGYVVSVYGENGKLVDYTVTAQDAQNGYVQIETPEFTQDGEYSLTATVTNMLGAEGREGVSVDITIDTNAEAATVTFESAGDDNIYNQAELGSDGTVTVNIALPDDVQAGDMVTINGQDTILTDQIIASGSIDIEALPSTEVTVTITDIAGNVSDPVIITTPDADVEALTANDTATTGEDNSVTIDVLANDENGSTITGVQAPTNSQGEPLGTVEIVMVDGKQQLKFTPSDDFDALNEGQSENVEFTYTTTDAAGNTGEANVNVTVEGQNNDLTYQSESAAYKNVIGYYELDANGDPISPATVVIDDQNGMESGTHLADLDPNKEYGFFIIANGANEVDANSVLTVDVSGNILIDGNVPSHNVYHNNPEFNADGKDHFVMQSDGNGGTTIKVEDLYGLGDADFNDVVMHLNYDINDIIANDVQANNDSAITNEESAVLIDVLANDKDATGDELSITQIQGQDVTGGQTVDVVVSNEVVGTARVVNGQIEFTPGDKFDSLNDGQSDQVTFSYTTSDGKAGEDTANVTVTVNGETDNTVPTSVDETLQVDLDSEVTQTTSVDVSGGDGHQVTNIVLTIDVSGSMTNGRHGGVVQLPDGSYTTRLQLAKESLENIINEFDGVGDVNVNLTTFNSHGSSYGWMSAQDAINTINRLQAGGGTNYEDAVHDTVANFNNVPAADKTVALFVSDGEPTVGNDGYYDRNMLDNKYIEEWKGFVEDNVDQLVIVGMGTGIKDTSYLETLAVEVGDVQVDMLVIENEVELNEVLIETIIHANNEVEGNLLDNVEGGDGAISLDSITIDGTVYTANNFPSEGVTTPEGGVLKVNFQTGDYSYKASTANFDADVTESFTVTASDQDGDVTTFGLNVTVNVDDSASAPTLTMDIGEATIVTTEGSDINPDLSNATDYGNGNNRWNEISTSNGDDKVIIGDNYEEVYLNDGNDNAQIGDNQNNTWGNIHAGEGNDTIVAGDKWNEVNLGNGNDSLSIGNAERNRWDDINAGNGNDTVIAGNNWDEVRLGDGNDTLNIGNNTDNTYSYISAGDGNDNITVGHGYSVINGGSGNDTVTFKGDANEYSVGRNSSGYTTVTYNATGQTTILKNVENYKFGGEDANTGQASTSYVYPITLNAGLTDTDGSESLSDITLNNIPNGVTLKDSDNNEISANADGTYTVPTDENGDATVTLVSQEEIAQDDIKDIKASVTSTESKGGDESTLTVTEDAFVIEDIADLKLDSDQPQQITGSDDYDTMIFEDDISLNFEKLAQNVKEMEAIDLRNEQADTLNEISSSDVLKITDEDNVLKILGEDGDKVGLDNGEGNWTKSDQRVSEEGETFDVWTNDDATVYIDTDIQVDI